MIPPQFDYHRATSVEDALDLLGTHADADPVVLAGGHGLLPDTKAREASPGVVVDIGDVEGLRGVESGDSAESPDSTAPSDAADSAESAAASDSDRSLDASDSADPAESLAVGALTTHADLAESAAAWERAPVLAEAAEHVGDTQVRNRGTVGGNLAEADPAADLPAAAVAADATLALRGPDGEREVAADEFFRADGGTALGDRELLTEIRVPAGRSVGAYAKKTHPATGYALVGVAVALAVEDGTVTDARLAANGVADAPVRLTAVEDALAGLSDRDELPDATDRASAVLDPAEARSDPTASGAFRLHLLESYAERGVRAALDRGTGDPRGGGDRSGGASR